MSATSPQLHPAAEQGLRIGIILRAVEQSYRHRFARVMVSALVVFGFSSVLATLADDALDHVETRFFALFLWLAGTFMSTIGFTFYAGLCDRVVGEWAAGDEPQPIGQVLRTLPYVRLLVADVLFVIVVTAASVVAVIPGFVAITLLAIVGPIIMIEALGPLSALRRSAQLVWPHFFFVALLATLPLMFEEAVLHIADEMVWKDSLWRVFVAHGLMGLTVGSFVGLVVTNVAYALVHRERAEAPT